MFQTKNYKDNGHMTRTLHVVADNFLSVSLGHFHDTETFSALIRAWSSENRQNLFWVSPTVSHRIPQDWAKHVLISDNVQDLCDM